jgi:pre-mRNA-processing factor 19
MQNEWDALMLEVYSLRESLTNTRQELSHSLYQQEASCRVIAKLIKERDEARASLANVIEQINQERLNKPKEETKIEPKEEPGKGVHAALLSSINNTFAKLSGQRKQRKIPKQLTNKEEIAKFTCQKEGNTNKSIISCICLSGNRTLTTLKNGEAHISCIEDLTKESPLTLHTQSINDAALFSTEFAILASSDCSASLWNINNQTKLRDFQFNSPVKAVAVLPVKDYALFGEKNSQWSMINIETGMSLFTTSLQEDNMLLQ